ncbi:transposase [Rhodopseudomonas boonkerdii]|uniref:REP-associated tyrosine transposase n=1 Tax=Rhodopseudomonas boonkerdii TaxID=475937 RepID=UPI001E341CAA|nr:transposase [Rhodopseudomonas boonkerdii]UGV27623.1 transposase [Rhodopseudomonas boonkerdii]
MPNYRRLRVDGGSWFFTVNLHDRRQTLLVDHVEALRDAVTNTWRTRPFVIDAFIVLPDHLHAIWTLPDDDSDFSGRWRSIKTHFTKSMPTLTTRNGTTARGERRIWQPRFWEHMIRDERDYENHVNYCYINPVKHGLVTRVVDWPYSSFHRDVRAGIFPMDWAGDASITGSFGER